MKRYNSRKRLNGKNVRNAHVIWNEHNPENPIRPGDGCVIHHVDGDKKHDSIENLEKLLDADHRRLHAEAGREALQRWRDENPEKARKQSASNARKMLDTLNAAPERLLKIKENRRKGTIAANKRRAGEKRSEE